jgi:hypothetical protein
MNWLKTIWNKIVSSTSKAPTLVVVEEEPEESVGDILYKILAEQGVGGKLIEELDVIAVFEQWYEGPSTEEDIRDSIQTFKSAIGGQINAKLNKVK